MYVFLKSFFAYSLKFATFAIDLRLSLISYTKIIYGQVNYSAKILQLKVIVFHPDGNVLYLG